MYITDEQLKGLTFQERLNLLTNKQRKYFNKIRTQYGIVQLNGKPGSGKTAILENIARILDLQYIDVRLSTKDETDVGSYPIVVDVKISKDNVIVYDDKESYKTVKSLSYGIPKWAIISNLKPTLIVFEELNRCQLPIRNAILQVILERRIDEFSFNENVYMASTGNLGDADGTDVEEYDTALKNRIIHIKHELPLNEWIDDYANHFIHPSIVSFLKSYPDFYERLPTSNMNDVEDAFPTARSWTMFSKYLLMCGVDKNYTIDEQLKGKYDMESVKQLVLEDCHEYVGSQAQLKFVKYLEDNIRLSIKDLINNYIKKKDLFANITREHINELGIQLIETVDINKLEKKQLSNILEFLDILDEDLLYAFIYKLIDKYNTLDTNCNITIIFKKYKHILHKTTQIYNDSTI